MTSFVAKRFFYGKKARKKPARGNCPYRFPLPRQKAGKDWRCGSRCHLCRHLQSCSALKPAPAVSGYERKNTGPGVWAVH